MQNIPHLDKIIAIIKDEGDIEIYIFGSYARGNFSVDSDIDIAVKGLKSSDFFRVYGKLLSEIKKDIDFVDLDEKSPFTEALLKSGELSRVA